MNKILIVEDDLDINLLIQKILVKEGYNIVSAFSGTEAELRLSLEPFDLLLCDLMLPGINGEDLIQKVRKNNTIPIIALTAKSAMEDKVYVLSLGADDYMTKPFDPRELLARVNVQLRRGKLLCDEMVVRKEEQEDKQLLVFRDISLNLESRCVKVSDEEIDLTAYEFAILKTMIEYPKKAFSKEALYEAVWHNGYYGEDNTISVHISNIRKKLAKVSSEEYIATVWGIGYKLNL